jgi:hypothetical protein
MDAVLLIVAWLAGVASLLLVADMIMADVLSRRAERVAARQPVRAAERAYGARLMDRSSGQRSGR